MTKVWAVKNSDNATMVIFCDDKPKRIAELNDQTFSWSGINEIARIDLPVEIEGYGPVEMALIKK